MISRKSAALFLVALCIAGTLLIKGCSTLPPLANRTISNAIVDTETTRLGRTISPLVAAHIPCSGIYGLRDARDAFAARVRLAAVAFSPRKRHGSKPKDIRGRQLARIRRLIQFRSTIGKAEHRDGARHRQPRRRSCDRNDLRRQDPGGRV